MTFRLRITGEFGVEKTIVAVALMLLYAVGAAIAAWALAGGVTLLLGALCAIEATADRRRRARAEHLKRGLDRSAT